MIYFSFCVLVLLGFVFWLDWFVCFVMCWIGVCFAFADLVLFYVACYVLAVICFMLFSDLWVVGLIWVSIVFVLCLRDVFA